MYRQHSSSSQRAASALYGNLRAKPAKRQLIWTMPASMLAVRDPTPGQLRRFSRKLAIARLPHMLISPVLLWAMVTLFGRGNVYVRNSSMFEAHALQQGSCSAACELVSVSCLPAPRDMGADTQRRGSNSALRFETAHRHVDAFLGACPRVTLSVAFRRAAAAEQPIAAPNLGHSTFYNQFVEPKGAEALTVPAVAPAATSNAAFFNLLVKSQMAINDPVSSSEVMAGSARDVDRWMKSWKRNELNRFKTANMRRARAKLDYYKEQWPGCAVRAGRAQDQHDTTPGNRTCWKFKAVAGSEQETATVFVDAGMAQSHQVSRWLFVLRYAALPLCGALLCALLLLRIHFGTVDVLRLVREQRKLEGRLLHALFNSISAGANSKIKR